MDLVDEGEGPHPVELLAQGEDQHQREAREVGDRAADVAQHDQVGATGPLRLVAGLHRDAAAGHRGADGTSEVERAPGPGVVLAAQPGRQPACERLDLAAHQLEVGLARRGEVDLLDRRPHGVASHVLGSADLGRAAAYLRVDQPLERPRLGLDQPPQRGVLPPRVVPQAARAAPSRPARRARPGSSRCTTTTAARPVRGPGSARTAAPPRAPASPARRDRPSPSRSPAPRGSRPAPGDRHRRMVRDGSAASRHRPSWPGELVLGLPGPAGVPLPDQRREVEVEDLVEAGAVVLALDQGRGVRRPQGLALTEPEARRSPARRRAPRPARPGARRCAGPRRTRCADRAGVTWSAASARGSPARGRWRA